MTCLSAFGIIFHQTDEHPILSGHRFIFLYTGTDTPATQASNSNGKTSSTFHLWNSFSFPFDLHYNLSHYNLSFVILLPGCRLCCWRWAYTAHGL